MVVRRAGAKCALMSSHAAPTRRASHVWWVTKTVPQGAVRRSPVPMAPSAEGMMLGLCWLVSAGLARPRRLPSSVRCSNLV